MLERDVLRTTHQGPSKGVDRRANGTKASLTTILPRNKCHNGSPKVLNPTHAHTHGPDENGGRKVDGCLPRHRAVPGRSEFADLPLRERGGKQSRRV
jgi:hypothetical protein